MENKKKLALLCFSLTGWETGERLKEGLDHAGYEVCLDGKSRYLQDSITESHKEWTRRQFWEADGIIFIGACGIAVRSIAPFVEKKDKDPAVLVTDECGKFVISLLSGHLGGANDLAKEAASILDATPVITTATDLHDKFAVDVFAKKNNCALYPLKTAKNISAALLAGETVGCYSEFPWEGTLPKGVVICNEEGYDASGRKPSCGVSVGIRSDVCPFADTLYVIPRIVSLGMGCRRGKESDALLAFAQECLKEAKIWKEACVCLASIDLKKDEEGLLALTDAWGLPFFVYSEKELREVPGEFLASSFVKKTTGVDNVCERSAVKASGGGTLIQKKKSRDGMTAALAIKDWRVSF